jgi:hypothetical protein
MDLPELAADAKKLETQAGAEAAVIKNKIEAEVGAGEQTAGKLVIGGLVLVILVLAGLLFAKR